MGVMGIADASSAATGDVLSDTAADSYKYCVARKPGECRSVALAGDIYVNCPNEVKRRTRSSTQKTPTAKTMIHIRL